MCSKHRNRNKRLLAVHGHVLASSKNLQPPSRCLQKITATMWPPGTDRPALSCPPPLGPFRAPWWVHPTITNMYEQELQNRFAPRHVAVMCFFLHLSLSRGAFTQRAGRGVGGGHVGVWAKAKAPEETGLFFGGLFFLKQSTSYRRWSPSTALGALQVLFNCVPK